MKHLRTRDSGSLSRVRYVKGKSMQNRIAPLAVFAIAICAAVTLSIVDSKINSNTIIMILGFAALAATQITSGKSVDQNTESVNRLNATVQNGGIERPMNRVLESDQGKQAIKTAISEVLDEQGNVKR